MPIYEYACAKCGEFEVNQRITEDPLKRCPTCRGKVKKLMSSTSFQLKGSGWYQTEYGSKKSDAGTDKSSKEKSAGSGDGASASKGESSPTSESSSSEKSTGTKEKSTASKDKSTSKKDTSAKAA